MPNKNVGCQTIGCQVTSCRFHDKNDVCERLSITVEPQQSGGNLCASYRQK